VGVLVKAVAGMAMNKMAVKSRENQKLSIFKLEAIKRSA
jgi:hypothetical protein